MLWLNAGQADLIPGWSIPAGQWGRTCCTHTLITRSVCRALSLEIKASPKVRAFLGEQVSLQCSFKSSSPITESLTVDWTYRPLTGGQMESIFHYQSVPYPTTVGKFKDRISWVGNVAKGDASIAIQSPVMSDNGTFICSVKNPPDVYHNIPQTMLIVAERGNWLSAPPRALPSPCIAHAGLAPRRGGASPAASLLLPLAAPGGGCVP
uniref:Myelin protein zero like 3 n=1 Tax=Aquila chrysaetos chrysaetos TaxID=223781 RepID=A0A663E4L5_AQUCH